MIKHSHELCWTQKLPSSLQIILFAVWSDFAKFRHFVTPLKNFGHFERVHLVFGHILRLFWQILYAIGQNFIDVNGQKLNK